MKILYSKLFAEMIDNVIKQHMKTFKVTIPMHCNSHVIVFWKC